MTYTVSQLNGRMILDSRGNPTVEVDLMLEGGAFGRAAVPSGASVGSKEALELRDGGDRWHGKGVGGAVMSVNARIAPVVTGKRFVSYKEFDDTLLVLDGTENKSVLGANAILATSLAFAKACAASHKQQLWEYLAQMRGVAPILPTPYLNIVNGGAHADNTLDIQEFMIVPHGFDDFAAKLQAGSEIYHTLKGLLAKGKLATNVGDEGGFAPNVGSARAVLDLIMMAIEGTGYKVGTEVSIALDVAASEFYKNGKYELKGEGLTLDAEGLSYYIEELCNNYPILSVEDPMYEGDYEGWKFITDLLGKECQIIGDDVFVTNAKLIEQGIQKGIANAVLIKPNQVGTLSETIEAVDTAHKAGYRTMMSHRSGETEDTSIAHLAIALGCGQIKSGAPCRTDRVCKYNELLRVAGDWL